MTALSEFAHSGAMFVITLVLAVLFASMAWLAHEASRDQRARENEAWREGRRAAARAHRRRIRSLP